MDADCNINGQTVNHRTCIVVDPLYRQEKLTTEAGTRIVNAGSTVVAGQAARPQDVVYSSTLRISLPAIFHPLSLSSFIEHKYNTQTILLFLQHAHSFQILAFYAEYASIEGSQLSFFTFE
ncbi:hypothetical protein RvY_11163 [Ramazzottius varieornatus]|uniref:Uncharacterized protein n=1 Tax=Ramazzottius varieornatus TaxID=947166 RepID=A0A1D1VJL5_RAMVA|nr:hypothetical protein RvY_11163 [Ramazzottius varieornatus]